MKKGLIVLLALAFTGKTQGQLLEGKHEGPVNWLSFEEAVALSKKEKKPILIDVYTTWCGPCKLMDKHTFADAQVAKILNNNFYPVKLNAEQREDISYDGVTFKWVNSGGNGYHQLAASLLNNKLQYPSLVFMNEDVKILQTIPGFQQPQDFHRIVQFIGEGHYKKMKWEEWQKVYKSPYGNSGS